MGRISLSLITCLQYTSLLHFPTVFWLPSGCHLLFNMEAFLNRPVTPFPSSPCQHVCPGARGRPALLADHYPIVLAPCQVQHSVRVWWVGLIPDHDVRTWPLPSDLFPVLTLASSSFLDPDSLLSWLPAGWTSFPFLLECHFFF